MKTHTRQILKTSIGMLAAAFLLLLYAMFYTNKAYADERDLTMASYIHELNAGGDEGKLVAALIITNSVLGFSTGVIDTAATAISPEGMYPQTYSAISQAFSTCPLFEMTNERIYQAWLAFSADKSNKTIGYVTLMFVNTACYDELVAIQVDLLRSVPKAQESSL